MEKKVSTDKPNNSTESTIKKNTTDTTKEIQDSGSGGG